MFNQLSKCLKCKMAEYQKYSEFILKEKKEKRESQLDWYEIGFDRKSFSLIYVAKEKRAFINDLYQLQINSTSIFLFV